MIVELVNQYKENAINHLEKHELYHVIEKLSNYKIKNFLSDKFIPTFLPFYNLDAPTISFFASKMQIDNQLDFSGWMLPINKVGRFKEDVQGLETFCEEVSEISNQCERFKKYLGSMFTEDLNQDTDKNKKLSTTKDKEKKEQDPVVFLDRISKLKITEYLGELLDKFIHYQKVTLVNFFGLVFLLIFKRNSKLSISYKAQAIYVVSQC